MLHSNKYNGFILFYVLIPCIIVAIIYYTVKGCGCTENFKEIHRTYRKKLKISNKESKKSYKDQTLSNNDWYNHHNCNAMYNNWMHSCQQMEKIFYQKTPQCKTYSGNMTRGDSDQTYFF